jgi:hypothetical protein
MKRLLLVSFILLIAGSLLASNMGFKLSYGLTNTGSYQLNWVSLPYYWGTSATASTVCSDIGGNAFSITYWDRPTEGNISWLCSGVGTDFTIAPGEAIAVKVSSPTTWTIVGSHNPTQILALANTGSYQLNWVSVPYHTLRTNASGICTDVGSNAFSITYWDRTTEGNISWLCSGVGTDFTLTPGEGIAVKVSSPTNWTPSHY